MYLFDGFRFYCVGRFRFCVMVLLKLPFCSQLINFLEKNILEICIYIIMINAYYEKESVLSFKEKTSQHWCFYFEIASKY